MNDIAEKQKDKATTTGSIAPKQLAEELGVDPKRIRAYLRSNYSRDDSAKNTNWALTAEVANDVRKHFKEAKQKPQGAQSGSDKKEK